MTDEEMAEKYVIDTGNNDCTIEAFLAGLKAGRPKWHKVADGDLPKEKKLYLATTMEGGLILAYYNGLHWETKYDMSASGHAVDVIFAWCELPKYKEM